MKAVVGLIAITEESIKRVSLVLEEHITCVIFVLRTSKGICPEESRLRWYNILMYSNPTSKVRLINGLILVRTFHTNLVSSRQREFKTDLLQVPWRSDLLETIRILMAILPRRNARPQTVEERDKLIY